MKMQKRIRSLGVKMIQYELYKLEVKDLQVEELDEMQEKNPYKTLLI